MTCCRQGLLDLVAAPGAMWSSSSGKRMVVSVLLHKLQEVEHARTKKDSLPPPSHPGNVGELGGVPYIL